MLAAQSGLFGLMGEGDIQSCSPQKGLIWAQHEPTNSPHARTHARTRRAGKAGRRQHDPAHRGSPLRCTSCRSCRKPTQDTRLVLSAVCLQHEMLLCLCFCPTAGKDIRAPYQDRKTKTNIYKLCGERILIHNVLVKSTILRATFVKL